MTTKTDTARQQAEAQLDYIANLMNWFEHASECDGDEDECEYINPVDGTIHFDDTHDIDNAQTAIHENALDVEVNYGWHAPGGMYPTTGEFPTPERFRISLCVGGPAVRIVGELNGYGEPKTARLEYQDWGTPWTEYISRDAELLNFASMFFYGS